jgi:hypothetical protein
VDVAAGLIFDETSAPRAAPLAPCKTVARSRLRHEGDSCQRRRPVSSDGHAGRPPCVALCGTAADLPCPPRGRSESGARVSPHSPRHRDLGISHNYALPTRSANARICRATRVGGGSGQATASWRDPANGLSCDVGYEVAVALVMQAHDLLLFGDGGDEEVGKTDGSDAPAGPEHGLDVKHVVPVLVGDVSDS